MKKRTKTVCILLSVLLILGLWTAWDNYRIQVTHYKVQNEKIPESFSGFRIAEVADLHNRDYGGRLIRKLENENPDIIAVTGDLIDSSHTDMDTALTFIQKASKIAPVYFVTGNHEAWTKGYRRFSEDLLKAGAVLLDNRVIPLKQGKDTIDLMGIEDPDFVAKNEFDGVQGAVIEDALKRMLIREHYSIVLSHRPELFENYVEVHADLVLTGHAHGGQVRIPFVGGLVAPNQGFFPKYTEGVHEKNGTVMIVSRGLGNSILPVRINNPPELVIVTLQQ